MILRTVSAGLAFAAGLGAVAVLAQQPPPSGTVAKLVDVQGNVLVSGADAMAAAVNGQRLAPGTRILTTAGAKATVVYDKGCSILLRLNQRYTVREHAECSPARAPEMGKVEEFGVLASSAVKNTGDSLIKGDLGVSPGSGVAGFPPGQVDGHIHRGDSDSAQAQKDAAKAYEQLASQECHANLAGQNLGGLTLTPGVYCFPGSPAMLSGELVLDPQGDPNAVFVFQVGTTLTTAAKSSIRVKSADGEGEDRSPSADDRDRKRAALCNVYWQVATSASLGKESYFLGNVFAIADIDIASDAQVYGRALSRSGQLTIDTGISQASCRPIIAVWPAAVVGGALCVGICGDNKKPKSPN